MYLRLENKTIFAFAVPKEDDSSVVLYALWHHNSELEVLFQAPLRRGTLDKVRQVIKRYHPEAKVDTFAVMGDANCIRKEVPLDRIEAAFIDRDGVLNHNDQSFKGGPVYTTSPRDIIIPNGVPDGIGWLTQMGILNFVVTMQNCISDGLVSPWQLEEVHKQMMAEWESSGGKIAGIYTCVTSDEDDLVKAREKSKVIRKICQEYKLNVENTIIIGDSSYDIEAGIIAGCGWEIQTRVLANKKTRARTVCGSFHDAVDVIWESLNGKTS